MPPQSLTNLAATLDKRGFLPPQDFESYDFAYPRRQEEAGSIRTFSDLLAHIQTQINDARWEEDERWQFLENTWQSLAKLKSPDLWNAFVKLHGHFVADRDQASIGDTISAGGSYRSRTQTENNIFSFTPIITVLSPDDVLITHELLHFIDDQSPLTFKIPGKDQAAMLAKKDMQLRVSQESGLHSQNPLWNLIFSVESQRNLPELANARAYQSEKDPFESFNYVLEQLMVHPRKCKSALFKQYAKSIIPLDIALCLQDKPPEDIMKDRKLLKNIIVRSIDKDFKNKVNQLSPEDDQNAIQSLISKKIDEIVNTAEKEISIKCKKQGKGK